MWIWAEDKAETETNLDWACRITQCHPLPSSTDCFGLTVCYTLKSHRDIWWKFMYCCGISHIHENTSCAREHWTRQFMFSPGENSLRVAPTLAVLPGLHMESIDRIQPSALVFVSCVPWWENRVGLSLQRVLLIWSVWISENKFTLPTHTCIYTSQVNCKRKSSE
jgi:hypothetical protein